MQIKINDQELRKTVKNQVNQIIQKDLRVMIRESVGQVIKGIARQELKQILEDVVNKHVQSVVINYVKEIDLDQMFYKLAKEIIQSTLKIYPDYSKHGFPKYQIGKTIVKDCLFQILNDAFNKSKEQ